MMLKQLVEQLKTEMQLDEELIANDNGSYSLILDPELPVTLDESQEAGISLYAVLAPLPESCEKFLLKTMTANLFGRETGGGILGLDREGKKVTLLTFLSEGLSYRDFRDNLEDFLNYADAWKAETTEFVE